MFRPSLDEAYRKRRQNEDDRLIVPDPSLSGYFQSDSLETDQLTTRSLVLFKALFHAILDLLVVVYILLVSLLYNRTRFLL